MTETTKIKLNVRSENKYHLHAPCSFFARIQNLVLDLKLDTDCQNAGVSKPNLQLMSNIAV